MLDQQASLKMEVILGDKKQIDVCIVILGRVKGC